MLALKLKYAWKGYKFSFMYDITIDVWCVVNKTRVPTTKLRSLWGFKLCHFLCFIDIEGGGRVRSEISVCVKGL
jgi:hypothetical protein